MTRRKVWFIVTRFILCWRITVNIIPSKCLRIHRTNSTDDNQVAARKANGIDVVFNIMNMFIDDADVYEGSCDSLESLIKDDRK